MKFRVIDKQTGKEADPYEIALHEDWAQELCYCDMDGFAILEDGTLLLVDECGNFEYCDSERFEVVFEDDRPNEKWEYLKKHITDIRDADGLANQTETCQFILNLMGVIEKEGEKE